MFFTRIDIRNEKERLLLKINTNYDPGDPNSKARLDNYTMSISSPIFILISYVNILLSSPVYPNLTRT